MHRCVRKEADMYKVIENENPGREVRYAISNTKKLLGGYFNMTLGSRTDVGNGSTYDGLTKEELEEMLKKADWKEVDHPSVDREGEARCRAYVTTDIPGGRFGLLNVRDLPDDTMFLAVDPKATGRVSISVAGVPGPPVKETFLITGLDADQKEEADRLRPVVFTFHPGEPVSPSPVPIERLADGSPLTKKEVLDMGFSFAKVDKNAAEKIRGALALDSEVEAKLAAHYDYVNAPDSAPSSFKRDLLRAEFENLDFRPLPIARHMPMNLSDMGFTGVNMMNMDLAGRDFSKSEFHETSFSGSDLKGSNFESALLEGVDFSGADIRGINIDRTNLKDAVFSVETKGAAQLLRTYPREDVIRCMLDSDPSFVKEVNALPGINEILEKSPTVERSYVHACDRLYDKLEEQGLVFADDKTAVFFVEGMPVYDGGEIPALEFVGIDTKTMGMLGLCKENGRENEEIEILLVNRETEGGETFSLGKYEYAFGYSNFVEVDELDEKLTRASLPEIKKVLGTVLAERAGFSITEMADSLHDMNTKLNAAAGLENKQAEKTEVEVGQG